MNEKPTPPAIDPTAQEQARAQRLQLARAFLQVFGNPRSRNTTQQLVISHLEKCANEGSAMFPFDDKAKDGIAIIAAGIHRDGAQTLLKVISRQIAAAEDIRTENPKPPVKTKR